MKVQVYCYDLTRGMAAALSPMLLGYQVEAVWHTGVVIDGRQEIFFGYGINKARAGATMFGQPARVLDMGETEVTPDVLEELLSDLVPRFRPQDYNLLWHNCNTFSNELVQLLTGEALPDYIMGQAQHIFNTPWGESLMPMILAMEGFTGNATASGMATQQQQQPARSAAAQAAASGAAANSAAAPPAGPAAVAPSAADSTAAAAAAAAAASSAAAVQVTTQAAAAAGSSSTQSDAAGVQPGSKPEAAAASAAANAGMAAVARATQQQQQQQELGTADESSAVMKAGEGVAGLSLTADSRAVQQQEQQ